MSDRKTQVGMLILGIWLAALPTALAVRTYFVWPTSISAPEDGAKDGAEAEAKDASKGDADEAKAGAAKGGQDDFTERDLLLLVAYCGALGASIHALSSFLYFVGNDAFTSRWVPWYLGRPVIGLGLAQAFYFAFRAGFVGLGDQNPGSVNLHGVCAISTIVGLFSTQAMEKLKQVAETIFVKPPAQRDALEKEAPVISGIEPSTLAADTGGNVVVKGAGFSTDSVVYVDGHVAESELRSDVALDVKVKPEWLTAGVNVEVFVKNPMPAGAKSDAVELVVT